MRYQPYIAKVSMSFSKLPLNYTEAVLEWSEAGLESEVGSMAGSAPLHPQLPSITGFNLAENESSKASLAVKFSDGSCLDEAAAVDIVFASILSRLSLCYRPYVDKTSGNTYIALLLSWQIDPLLINDVDHYELNTAGVNNPDDPGQVRIIDSRVASVGIQEIDPEGEVITTSLSAIGFDESPIGIVNFSLYTPKLSLIPTTVKVPNLGYNKTMDSGGVQETHLINHNQTLAQLTEPTQIHAPETTSLGDPIQSIDPKIVTSSSASDYINSFNPNDSNQPFDYSDAKAKGQNIAPQATAKLQQEHTGNYTHIHNGTLNHTRTVDQDTQFTNAPQITNTINTYTGTYSGDTHSETAINKYEQNDQEVFMCNQFKRSAPTFTESINTLNQQSNVITINAQNINLNGQNLHFNDILNINADEVNFGYSDPPAIPPFVLMKKDPIALPDQDYKGFVATVYAETYKSRVLMSDPKTRYASGALLYYWYVTDQKTYQEIISIVKEYTAKMNADPSIHSIRTTGYYNTADFTEAADDTFAKKAVASVIVNRAQGNYFNYQKYQAAKTATRPNGDIWKAYTDTYVGSPQHQFNGYGDANYNDAINSMAKMKTNQDIDAIDKEEIKNLYLMLWDIYYHREVTTDANMYFSPIAQIETIGKFAKWALTRVDFENEKGSALQQQELKQLRSCWRDVWTGKVPIMLSDDFAFLMLPEGLLAKKHH